MKEPKEEKTTIEMGDMDFDEAVGTESEISSDLQAKILASVKKAKEQSMAYTDKRIEQINAKLAIHQETLDAHTTSITNIEKIVEAIASGKAITAIPKESASSACEDKPRGILDATLGTVGGILHGVVDTAAFICESAVDLVTLGKARRSVQ